MATAKIEVPHVYTALANILKNLSVKKGGVLPGNMGGKPYITAVDASEEVKRQFVENDLIFLPDEEVVANEHIIHKDRLSIRILIRGEYTIVSTVDGSSAEVSGTGDGLATGTAVASNIASTNALKNALLRTFLITEQSVEDSAKNGVPDAPAPANRALNNARSPKPVPKNDAPDARTAIRDWIGTDKARKDQANGVVEKLKKSGKKGNDIYEAAATELGV